MAWLVTEGLAGACWVPSDYKVASTSHILMCYPMGDNGTALNDIAVAAGGAAAGDAAIIDAILADLDRTFPQALGLASANYVEGIVQNWGADPYTLGVYSYPKIGTYTTASDSRRRDLQDPVANGRVFFAGEGTHTTHPSTVPGALHEGERAARALHAINTLYPSSCSLDCFSFNIDADEELEADALTDGLLVIRHLFGFSGDALIANATSNVATRQDAAEITIYLNDAESELDIDGDGEARALTDGLLLIRYLFGFSGNSLISGAVSETAARTSAEQIETYISARIPAS
jgi:hypothetical protein